MFGLIGEDRDDGGFAEDGAANDGS